jgi:hypothetical protein
VKNGIKNGQIPLDWRSTSCRSMRCCSRRGCRSTSWRSTSWHSTRCRFFKFHKMSFHEMSFHELSFHEIPWYQICNYKIFKKDRCYTKILHSKALQSMYSQIEIFGMQIYHLASLVELCTQSHL